MSLFGLKEEALGCYFRVMLGADLDANFSSVRGLSYEIEMETYQEGGNNAGPRFFGSFEQASSETKASGGKSLTAFARGGVAYTALSGALGGMAGTASSAPYGWPVTAPGGAYGGHAGKIAPAGGFGAAGGIRGANIGAGYPARFGRGVLPGGAVFLGRQALCRCSLAAQTRTHGRRRFRRTAPCRRWFTVARRRACRAPPRRRRAKERPAFRRKIAQDSSLAASLTF